MKKLAILSLALGLSAGAFAQGSISVTDGNITPGLAKTTAGNYYSGSFGLQVYVLNGALPGNINGLDGVNSPQAFANLSTDGFLLEKTFLNQTITAGNAGVFTLGEVDMPDVSPAGSTVTIALVAWDGAQGSFSAAANGGVIAFSNPTADYTITPHPTAPFLTGWDAMGKDLIMTPVPEPSIIALAGLGAAALMGLRRRK